MLLPAITELNLCRTLECSWVELQEMPEETIDIWLAYMAGEDQKRREASAKANAAAH